MCKYNLTNDLTIGSRRPGIITKKYDINSRIAPIKVPVVFKSVSAFPCNRFAWKFMSFGCMMFILMWHSKLIFVLVETRIVWWLMTWLLTEPSIVLWRIEASILLILSIFIVILAIEKDFRRYKANTRKRNGRFATDSIPIVPIATWLTTFILIIVQTLQTILVWCLIPKSWNCQTFSRIFVWFVHLSIISIYFLIIIRTHFAYKGSSFAYPRSVMLTVLLITLSLIFTASYFDITGVSHIEIDFDYFNTSEYYCGPIGAKSFLFATFIINSVMSTVAVVLFVKPLIEMNNHKPTKGLLFIIVNCLWFFVVWCKLKQR